jgi:hypothetical protein
MESGNRKTAVFNRVMAPIVDWERMEVERMEPIMTAAKLPPELMDKQPRQVSQLQPGETGYVVFTDLRVNHDMKCYLPAKAELRKKGGSTIQVRRDETGYHVTVPSVFTYSPSKSNSTFLLGLVPVASVTVVSEEFG